jgi:hypothetical protein
LTTRPQIIIFRANRRLNHGEDEHHSDQARVDRGHRVFLRDEEERADEDDEDGNAQI